MIAATSLKACIFKAGQLIWGLLWKPPQNDCEWKQHCRDQDDWAKKKKIPNLQNIQVSVEHLDSGLQKKKNNKSATPQFKATNHDRTKHFG